MKVSSTRIPFSMFCVFRQIVVPYIRYPVIPLLKCGLLDLYYPVRILLKFIHIHLTSCFVLLDEKVVEVTRGVVQDVLSELI